MAATLPVLSPAVLAQASPPAAGMVAPGDGPGLFFTRRDLPALRERYRRDPRFAALRERLESVDRAAERTFLREEVRLNDPLGDFRRVHDIGELMAFVYLMTGDDEAAALAKEAARTMIRFPVWDFFLEHGSGRVMGNQRAPSGVIAMSCMIDWLGDALEPAEREQWIEVMMERGCVPAANTLGVYLDTHHALPWDINPDTLVAETRAVFPTDGHRRIEITSRTNLRAAPAGAMAIGVALLRRFWPNEPRLAAWQDLATRNMAFFEEMYFADGCYGEGVSYANYTSESLFMGIEALRRAGGPDLNGIINWSRHVDFMLEMAMPTAENPYEIINISDAGRHRTTPAFVHPAGRPESRSAMPFWVARNYRDGAAQWFGENLAAEHNVWSLVFFDESVAPVAPLNEPKLWIGEVEWPVMRTGYRPEDLVACLRSGDGYNHEHADRNAIIIKAFGDELVVDPLRPPYAFYDPAWMMRTTAGHSGILINGAGHFYNNGVEGTNMTPAQARVVDQASTDRYAWVTSDATQAYRLVDVEIKQVVRSMVVFYDLAVVLIVDQLGMWHHPADYEARFMTSNSDDRCEVAASGSTFTIKRPLAAAHGQVFCRQPVELAVETLPIPEERARHNPFVAVRTGGTQQAAFVTALALSPADGRPAVVTATHDEHGFDLNLSGAAGRVRCRVEDGGEFPRIAVQL